MNSTNGHRKMAIDSRGPPLPRRNTITTTSSSTTSTNHFHHHHSITSSAMSSSSSSPSTFRSALLNLKVPSELLQGVECLRVFADGQTQKSYLTLSPDKFTLYLTTERKRPRKSTSLVSFLLKSSKQQDQQQHQTYEDAARVPTRPQYTERAIDIGAIARIQRGHGTKRFVQATKLHRQDAMHSLLKSAGDETMSSHTAMLNPSHCFSILFRGDWTLDLIMLGSGGPRPSLVDRDTILDALDLVLTTYQRQKHLVANDVLLLRYHWMDAVSDKDMSQLISSSELQGLLPRMNYYLRPKDFQDAYEKFTRAIALDRKSRKQGLTFEQVSTLLHKLKRDSWIVKPINVFWNELFGELMKNGKPRMHVSCKTFLEKFLHDKQGETSKTLEDVMGLFDRLNQLEMPHSTGDEVELEDPHRIDKNRFEAYLLMEENDAFCPTRQSFDPTNMNRPLSEYWINSSHNTYLTGDQLRSNSSVDMYSNALYRGCRCLELDIWDGSELDDDGRLKPVVWHGHTMTSKISFKEIIKALKLFVSFHPDTFPLILSFENHCSLPYQEIMAEQLQSILGKSLYIPKEENLLLGRLPSPMELKGMIVIKGRRPSNLNYDDDSDDDDSDDGPPSTVPSTTASADPSSQSTTNQVDKTKVRHEIHPHLARLTLFHGTKLTSWEASHMIPTHHMHSFNENKVRALARKTDRLQWAIFNQSHMSRTYPAGSRIDSSNYLPILPWALGCQMVSLNFQTPDTGLLLNDGRFRENGGCGYVLKPDELLQLQAPVRKKAPKPLKLTIRVLSGHCLPKPRKKDNSSRGGDRCIDPYVRVAVFDVKNGVKEDAVTYQTGVVYNNGFNPIWNEGRMKFTVESWVSAMVQLTVFDKASPPSSDEFVATAAIPISCLRQGLRSVKLTDATNTRSGALDFASLLIEVKKTWGDSVDLDRRIDSFGSSSHGGGSGVGSIKPIPMPPEFGLERAHTDSYSTSSNRRSTAGLLPRPERVDQRSRTETTTRSPRHSTIGTTTEKSRLERSRTDQSKGGESLSSLAEF